MPLIIGTTNIGDIYKGTTKIDSVYKGTTLVYTSGTWEEYLYEYIYYSLVPTTINSRVVKNRARVNTIYGNSVVENQLIDKTYLVAQESNILVDTSTGYLEVDLSSYTGYDHTVVSNRTIKVISGHTYLFTGLNSSVSSSATTWWVQLRTTSTSISPSNLSTTNIFTANAGGDCNLLIYTYVNYTANAKVSGYPQLIDLTQRYPINTPTTLTDIRVQALLNRGYISYNTGSIKSVNVGAISSEDSNNNPLQSIAFKYQGSGVDTAHDTLEITSSAYVFTKNMASVDLSTLTFTQSGDRYYTNDLSSIIYRNVASASQNSLSTKYQVVDYNHNANTSNSISENSGYLWVNTSSTPTGTFEYQLATPQVISIPKKHLGIVDLGGLNWSVKPNGRIGTGEYFKTIIKRWSSYGTAPTMMRCAKYINVSPSNLEGNSPTNMALSMSGNGYEVIIYDSELIGLNNTQIQAKLSGQYLFYETENEVADIPISLGVESGGTLTTDSQVLPNILMEIKCK